MDAQIQRYPYAQNVFLMMKFRRRNKILSDFILAELKQHGFHGVRADAPDWNITRNTYNPIAALYCCRFGLALFDEPEKDQAYSPNVAYELGMMHYQDKNCLILRKEDLPPVPFDLVKDIHESYKSDLEVRDIIARWISSIQKDILLSAYDKPIAAAKQDSLTHSAHLSDVIDLDKFRPSVHEYLDSQKILTVADASKIDFRHMLKQKSIGIVSVRLLVKELLEHGIISESYFLKKLLKSKIADHESPMVGNQVMKEPSCPNCSTAGSPFFMSPIPGDFVELENATHECPKCKFKKRIT